MIKKIVISFVTVCCLFICMSISSSASERRGKQLEEYLEKGLYLESYNRDAIDSYIGPIIDLQMKEAVLVGYDFFPYAYSLMVRTNYPDVSEYWMQVEEIVMPEGTYCITTYKFAYEHQHDFLVDTIPPSCLHDGMQITTCTTCDYYEEIILPRTGHIDSNGDYICDDCGEVLSEFSVGDRQLVSTNLTGEYETMSFTCISTEYKGGVLFLADEVIPYTVSGWYGEENSYGDSEIREWLNQYFYEGLSVANNILPVRLDESGEYQQDYVFSLSRAEVRSQPLKEYTLKSWNREYGKSGYWTRSADNGGYAYAVANDGYLLSEQTTSVNIGVRPAYVLKRSDGSESPSRLWQLGDVQERNIDGIDYIFRCIDSDYVDASGSRMGALFFCDEIIGGDIMIFDSDSRNLWSESTLRQWMNESVSNKQGMLEATTTVKYSYTGNSADYDETLSMLNFTRVSASERVTSDYLFCLSLEEAVQYKEYLWKLNGSIENNHTNYGTYTAGYWLRTSGINNGVYSVNYEGIIDANTTDNERIGFRPAYVVEQKE